MPHEVVFCLALEPKTKPVLASHTRLRVGEQVTPHQTCPPLLKDLLLVLDDGSLSPHLFQQSSSFVFLNKLLIATDELLLGLCRCSFSDVSLRHFEMQP
jgi:hypothetical protein